MEFHAIILCDQDQLAPLTGGSGLAKPLLPVANKPLIYYSIEWCRRASFAEITIISPSQSVEPVKSYIDASFGSLDISISVIPLDKATGEVIASLWPKIKTDFVILPCDFISDIDPQTLIDLHRNRDDGIMITSVFYKNSIESLEKFTTCDYVVHTPRNATTPELLDYYSLEFVKNKKTLPLRTSLLKRHSNPVISSKLLDSSIVFCSSQVKAIVDSADVNSITSKDRPWNKIIRDLSRRSWRHGQALESVAMVFLPEDSTFIRAVNIPAYVEANRYLMKLHARNAPTSRPAQTPGAATIGSDSIVGERTVVGERTSIKRTVVGNDCILGKKCRLTGCLILDGVTIEDDVYLENCVIGPKAVIETKSKLTGCNIEGRYIVTRGSERKNETLESLGQDLDLIASELSGSDDDESSSEGQWEESEGEDIDDEADDGLFDRS